MTYALLCLPMLVLGAVLAVVAARRLDAVARRRRWAAIGLAVAALLVLTAAFDSLMIAAGLFGYADGTRLGPTVGLAPIEDFAYPIAAALIVPAVFTLVRRSEATRRRDEDLKP